MSPSCYITVRTTKSGRRYVVRYRVGGRYSKLRHAGSFKTQKAARDRRDFVISELAAGRDPLATLRAIDQAQPARTYREVGEAYKQSRHDLELGSTRNVASHLARLNDLFGDRDPATLTVREQIEAVGQLAQALTPGTLVHYWATHRQVLDFAGVQPNPARDRAVRLPRQAKDEPNPPTAAHVLAMLERIPDLKLARPFVTIEQTAMAIGETEALAWGDVDVAGCTFRLRRATVKGKLRARARWVQVPEWLMDILAESCPVEDRTPERRVFQGLRADRLRQAMARACNTAGIPVYTPHDLRHRRVSLWHGQGVPAKELAARAGHSDAWMTLNVYSHVMPLDEVPQKSLERVLVRAR